MRAVEESKLPGVIETLSAGFDRINRRPWIMLVPVMVDLLLWRGPHITPAPFFRDLVLWYQEAMPPDADFVAPSGQRLDELNQMGEAAAEGVNLLSLLVLTLATVPTTTAGRAADTTAVIEIGSGVALVLVVLLLHAVGLLLGCVYLGLIAQQVRTGAVNPAYLLIKMWPYFAGVALLTLIFLGIGVAVGIPLSLLVALSSAFGGPLAAVLLAVAGTVVYIIAVWVLLFLFFAVDAIIAGEVSAPRAIVNSVFVVARNLWPALGLIALTYVIVAGTHVIWGALGHTNWGTVVGMFGNAYIASGLAAASMLFYLSRSARLEEDGYYKRLLRRG